MFVDGDKSVEREKKLPKKKKGIIVAANFMKR